MACASLLCKDGRGLCTSQVSLRGTVEQLADALLQGAYFLHSDHSLVVPLSAEMLEQEKEARKAAEAAAAAAAAAAALHGQRSMVKDEEGRLFRALQDVRKVSKGCVIGRDSVGLLLQ